MDERDGRMCRAASQDDIGWPARGTITHEVNALGNNAAGVDDGVAPAQLGRPAAGAVPFDSFAGKPFPSNARHVALPAEDSSLEGLFCFLDAACDDAALPRRARFDVRLAMEELFVNVVRHGFPKGRPRVDVQLAAWCAACGDSASRALHLVMSDAGVPYDPLAYEPQLVSGELGQNNKVGGLGIFLVRERMDLVEYRFEHGCNTIHLVKRA